jgi:3-dehydroquinate synthase
MGLEVERSSFIVGIGGGIVCDITGFVASTYLRGVRFGFVSTTLLSQVDASVGGKNGVNFGGYKNIIGVFNQPEFVICDLSLLGTLPGKEILCGLAEIVKHAVIGDAELFGYLEENYKNAFSLDRQVIERLVYDSIKIKSTIVNKDEKEKGERRKLNFGHTIGHAIEKTIGISHGEAVSAGMVAAATIAVNRNLLSPEDATRIKLLLKNLRLPTEILTGKERLIEALKKDKKREGDAIHFVLPDGIGKVIVKQIPIKEIKNMLTAAEAELSS